MKFFIGLFIGFVLGTTFPEQTRYFVKLGLKKTVEVLKKLTDEVNTNQSYQLPQYSKPQPTQDEDYKPLYETPTSEQSSF